MGTDGQKVYATVNGEPIGTPRRGRGGDWRFYSEEIDWLLNEAPGLLGEKGMAIDPNGGGARNPANTGPLHDQRIRAIWAVERYRQLAPVWRRLTEHSQAILSARYTRKRHWEIRGLKAVFEDMASVALVVTSDREALTKALQKSSARQAPIVTEARRKSEFEVKAAHEEWRDLKRLEAQRWAEG